MVLSLKTKICRVSKHANAWKVESMNLEVIPLSYTSKTSTVCPTTKQQVIKIYSKRGGVFTIIQKKCTLMAPDSIKINKFFDF